MRVLVACEYSGKVRDAFIRNGHDAMSCDLLPTDAPGPHYEGDVFDIIDDGWDLLIAFPPCTDLAVSGARWFKEKQADGRQQRSIEFFMAIVEAGEKIGKYAIENPIGIMSKHFRKPNQIIQPWQHGHEATKSTCLWTKGLPDLVPTNIVGKGERHVTKSGKSLPAWYNLPPSETRWKERSETFQGIANAMADQWGKE